MKESGWIITTHCNVTGMIVDILVKHIPQWLNQSQVGLGMFGDVTIQSWPSFCHLRRYPPGHPAIPFQGDELSLRISVDVRMESNVLKDFTVNLTRNLKLSRMVIFFTSGTTPSLPKPRKLGSSTVCWNKTGRLATSRISWWAVASVGSPTRITTTLRSPSAGKICNVVPQFVNAKLVHL